MRQAADTDVSQVDFMLLLMLAELGCASGKTLDQLVVSRGYRAWAGIGSSSIYARLRRLQTDQLADSVVAEKGPGRGPRPRLFTLNSAGQTLVRQLVIYGLCATREHDPRFQLALCGIDLIGKEKARQCLDERQAFLRKTRTRLTQQALGPAGQSTASRLIFDRIIHTISAEIQWLQNVKL